LDAPVEQAIGWKTNGSPLDPPPGRKKAGVATAERLSTAKKKAIAQKASRARLAVISDL
jgi:hypothetical protein